MIDLTNLTPSQAFTIALQNSRDGKRVRALYNSGDRCCSIGAIVKAKCGKQVDSSYNTQRINQLINFGIVVVDNHYVKQFLVQLQDLNDTYGSDVVFERELIAMAKGYGVQLQ